MSIEIDAFTPIIRRSSSTDLVLSKNSQRISFSGEYEARHSKLFSSYLESLNRRDDEEDDDEYVYYDEHGPYNNDEELFFEEEEEENRIAFDPVIPFAKGSSVSYLDKLSLPNSLLQSSSVPPSPSPDSISESFASPSLTSFDDPVTPRSGNNNSSDSMYRRYAPETKGGALKENISSKSQVPENPDLNQQYIKKSLPDEKGSNTVSSGKETLDPTDLLRDIQPANKKEIILPENQGMTSISAYINTKTVPSASMGSWKPKRSLLMKEPWNSKSSKSPTRGLSYLEKIGGSSKLEDSESIDNNIQQELSSNGGSVHDNPLSAPQPVQEPDQYTPHSESFSSETSHLYDIPRESKVQPPSAQKSSKPLSISTKTKQALWGVGTSYLDRLSTGSFGSQSVEQPWQQSSNQGKIDMETSYSGSNTGSSLEPQNNGPPTSPTASQLDIGDASPENLMRDSLLQQSKPRERPVSEPPVSTPITNEPWKAPESWIMAKSETNPGNILFSANAQKSKTPWKPKAVPNVSNLGGKETMDSSSSYLETLGKSTYADSDMQPFAKDISEKESAKILDDKVDYEPSVFPPDVPAWQKAARTTGNLPPSGSNVPSAGIIGKSQMSSSESVSQQDEHPLGVPPFTPAAMYMKSMSPEGKRKAPWSPKSSNPPVSGAVTPSAKTTSYLDAIGKTNDMSARAQSETDSRAGASSPTEFPKQVAPSGQMTRPAEPVSSDKISLSFPQSLAIPKDDSREPKEVTNISAEIPSTEEEQSWSTTKIPNNSDTSINPKFVDSPNDATADLASKWKSAPARDKSQVEAKPPIFGSQSYLDNLSPSRNKEISKAGSVKGKTISAASGSYLDNIAPPSQSSNSSDSPVHETGDNKPARSASYLDRITSNQGAKTDVSTPSSSGIVPPFARTTSFLESLSGSNKESNKTEDSSLNTSSDDSTKSDEQLVSSEEEQIQNAEQNSSITKSLTSAIINASHGSGFLSADVESNMVTDTNYTADALSRLELEDQNRREDTQSTSAFSDFSILSAQKNFSDSIFFSEVVEEFVGITKAQSSISFGSGDPIGPVKEKAADLLDRSNYINETNTTKFVGEETASIGALGSDGLAEKSTSLHAEKQGPLDFTRPTFPSPDEVPFPRNTPESVSFFNVVKGMESFTAYDESSNKWQQVPDPDIEAMESNSTDAFQVSLGFADAFDPKTQDQIISPSTDEVLESFNIDEKYKEQEGQIEKSGYQSIEKPSVPSDRHASKKETRDASSQSEPEYQNSMLLPDETELKVSNAQNFVDEGRTDVFKDDSQSPDMDIIGDEPGDTKDLEFLSKAISLVQSSGGEPSETSAFPNPSYGAVLVSKHGLVLGYGVSDYRKDAVVAALINAGCGVDVVLDWIISYPDDSLRAEIASSTLYVTLEPSTYGSGTTHPSIVQLIQQANISRVVIGSPDPAPDRAGKGTAALKKHGVAVSMVSGLRKECQELISDYAGLAVSNLRRMARTHFERFGRPLGLLHCSVVDSDKVEAFARNGNAFGTILDGSNLSFRKTGAYEIAPPPEIVWTDQEKQAGFEDFDGDFLSGSEFKDDYQEDSVNAASLMIPWYFVADAVVATFPRPGNGPPEDDSVAARLNGLKWLAIQGERLPPGVERIIVMDAADVIDLPLTNGDPNLPSGVDIESFWVAEGRKPTRIILRRSGSEITRAAAASAASAAKAASLAAQEATVALEAGDVAKASGFGLQYLKTAQQEAEMIQRKLDLFRIRKRFLENKGVIVESIEDGEPYDVLEHIGKRSGFHCVAWRAGCWGERGVQAIMGGAFQFISAHMAVESAGSRFWQIMLAENAIQAACGPQSRVKIVAAEEDMSLEYCDDPDVDGNSVMIDERRPVRHIRLDCRITLLDAT